MTKTKIIRWECVSCGTINTSDRMSMHDMNWCKECSQSAVDAEEHYMRVVGEVRFLDN